MFASKPIENTNKITRLAQAAARALHPENLETDRSGLES